MLSELAEPLSSSLGLWRHCAEVLEPEVSPPCFAFVKESTFFTLWRFGLPVGSQLILTNSRHPAGVLKTNESLFRLSM